MNRDKIAFLVLLDKPEDVGIRDMQDYIRDAVKSSCGGFEPPGIDSAGDPRWEIGKSVEVIRPFATIASRLTNWGRLLIVYGAR